METFNFKGIEVRVIDCKNECVDFRVVEVFDQNGKMVYDFRTTAKGKRAAKIGYSTALQYRYI